MRVKIKESENRPEFKFGQIYDLHFYGCSFWLSILYTRKKYVYVEHLSIQEVVNNVPKVKVTSRKKMSKRELKQLLNDSKKYHFIQSICKVDDAGRADSNA